jgi:mannose-6-phosphate isomerase-like protein (cupin superfamily)
MEATVISLSAVIASATVVSENLTIYPLIHRIEKEQFIVVNGILDIEIDGLHQILEVGESVMISPGKMHKLKSAGKNPVRVLCFNFPAFSPEDMHCVE